MHPVEADGCGLVILRERPGFLSVRHDVLESGVLAYDGEVLKLEGQDGRERVVSDQEQLSMLNVTPANQFPECAGFEYFILLDERS